MIATLFALILTASDVATFGFGLVIASDSDCPTAAQVRDGLRGLSFPSPDAASVAVHGEDEEVTVVFGAPAGLQRGPRKLALTRECDRRASAVALLIAAWLGQLSNHPPSMTLESLPPPPPLPRPPRPALPPVRRPPPIPSETTVSIAGSYDFYPADDSSGSPALALELAHGSVGSGPGYSLALSSQLAPSVQGVVKWVRPAVDLGGRWRVADGRGAFDIALGVAAGELLAWSAGGPAGHSLVLGLSAAMRIAFSRSDKVPWLEVRGRAWTSNSAATLAGGFDTSTILPWSEVALTLGWTRRGL